VADWIDEDIAPRLESLIRGPGVRHSLFGMLAAGGGRRAGTGIATSANRERRTREYGSFARVPPIKGKAQKIKRGRLSAALVGSFGERH
jgi:hypothetical protein